MLKESALKQQVTIQLDLDDLLRIVPSAEQSVAVRKESR